MENRRGSTLVKLPNDVLERNDVTCSRGPLGVQLNQTSSGIVVVTSFLALPNGGKGEIESSGLVRQGDALLCINEVPIEFESYGNVLATLRGEFPITLTFGRTSEELAREVREDVIRRALQVRESEDRKRLEDLEAARIQRENEQRRQLSGQRKSQFDRVNVVRSSDKDQSTRVEIKAMPTFAAPPVYTAKDFKTARFTTFQKQVAVILVMMALFRSLWTFSKQPILADVVPVEGEFIITSKHKEMTADAVREDLLGSNKVLSNATDVLLHHTRGGKHKSSRKKLRVKDTAPATPENEADSELGKVNLSTKTLNNAEPAVDAAGKLSGDEVLEAQQEAVSEVKPAANASASI